MLDTASTEQTSSTEFSVTSEMYFGLKEEMRTVRNQLNYGTKNFY